MRRRQSVAALVVLIGLPAAAAAQSPLPTLSPTLPPIGFPLPPIGYPLPPIGLSPVVEPQPATIGQPSPGPEARPRSPRRFSRTVPTVIYFPTPYGWGYPQPGPPPSPSIAGSSAGAISERQPSASTGRLELDVRAEGQTPQVFVDGVYVGTLDDRKELDLEAGVHRIEIRAAGYETLRLDVRIEAQRSISYRDVLKRSPARSEPDAPAAPDPLDPKTATATPASPPTTLYYIPGCYLGNVPPGDVALPATCDMTRLIVHKP